MKDQIPLGQGSGFCPDARISSSVLHKDGRAVVNIDTYIPYYLASVNNALSAAASKHYLRSFGIGVVDWRVISMLACDPGILAWQVCDIVSLDKAAVSRALKSLHKGGYVTFEEGKSDKRKRRWWLTDTGYDLHDKLLRVALAREARLIAGVDAADLEAFLRVMRIMRANVRGLDEGV